MANIEITNSAGTDIVVWDPVFKDDIFASSYIGVYAAGTMLGRRDTTGKLKLYNATDDDGSEIPVALLYEELVNDISASDISISPIIAGRVRREDIVVNDPDIGEDRPITDVESDVLSAIGIIPLTIFYLTNLDN